MTLELLQYTERNTQELYVNGLGFLNTITINDIFY